MRRTMHIPAVILAVLGTMLALAGPANAGPPVPYSDHFCHPDGRFRACETSEGFLQTTQTPSGNTEYHNHGTLSVRIVVNRTGEVVSESETKINEIVIANSATTQVQKTRSLTMSSFLSDGITYDCKSIDTFTYANGEVRQTNSELRCTPPLPA